MSQGDDTQQKLGDADPIVDAKGFMAVCNTADGDNRADALDDLAFLRGDQWDPQVERMREIDNRPCLTINKLPTFLHQVTNQQRMNVPSIKVSPVGSGSDVKKAKILQGSIRHIEYISNADVAYDTAVGHAAAIGFGYFRIVTDYCDPKSFDQDLRFKRIRNPFTVYFDPFSVEADGSDAKRCLIAERVPMADFKREYPDAATAPGNGFDTGIGDPTNKDWWGADFVRVAEFYRIEYTDDELVQLPDGSAEYRSVLEAKNVEIPKGVKTRPTQRPQTMWYKLTAFEVLEKTEIMCKWIPVFPVYGDELDVDGKVTRSGIVRNAKDPAKMYNFWMTAATEEVALRPKTPYIGAEGQFEGYEDDWNAANVKSFSYLEYKPVTLDGSLAPPPQRQPMADMPTGMITMAMHANDNIKATTGLFDSSLGARGNATSGIQEREQQRQGDVANFHFTDNLNRAVRHAGRCIIDMYPHYYDAARTVRIMGEDGKISAEEINTTRQVQRPNPMTGQMETIEEVLNDMTVGEYDVVVKAGPSYDSLRQEAAEGQIGMAKVWPKLMEVAGDKIIRNLDWPGADEIADRVAKTLPPGLQDPKEGEDENLIQTPQGPIPVDQVPTILEQMNAQMQEMGAQLQEASTGVAKAKVDGENQIAKAQIEAESRLAIARANKEADLEIQRLANEGRSDVEELKGMVQLLLAKVEAPPQLEAEVTEDLTEEEAPDKTSQLLDAIGALIASQQQPPQPGQPRQRRAMITAPSGAQYHVELNEGMAP